MKLNLRFGKKGEKSVYDFLSISENNIPNIPFSG